MKRIIILITLGLFLLASQAITDIQTTPTTQQIQDKINEGNKIRETYEKAYQKTLEAANNCLKNFNDETYNKFVQARRSQLDAAKKLSDNRNSIITDVLAKYGIVVPPGQQIFYDVKCQGECVWGYCSVKCPIGLCEKAFKEVNYEGIGKVGGTPGWIAAVIKHELEHKKQINPGPPPSWKPEYNGKDPEDDARAEYEAWQAAKKCAEKTELRESEKKIIDEMKEHYKKIMNAQKSVTPEVDKEKKSSLPGEILHKRIILINNSNTTQNVNCTITDSLDWMIIPNEFSTPIGPEEEISFLVNVYIPPDANPGTINEMFCHVETEGETSTDFAFIEVVSTVDVIAGPNRTGMRGQPVVCTFTIQSHIQSTPDSIQVIVSNPLGWPIVQSFFDFILYPGQQVELEFELLIPPDVPFWTTNLIYCTATSKTDSNQKNTDWLSVEVIEVDVGPYLVESPLGTKQIGSKEIPEVWVNNSGHVECFFDVFVKIDFPTMHTDSLIGMYSLPGKDMLIQFNPIILNDTGTFNITFFTRVFGGDADSTNDSLKSTFTVKQRGITVAQGWNMVSVPYIVPDPRKEILFPTSISNAFAYITTTGYEAKDTLDNSVGYWLKFSEPQLVEMVGDIILNDTFNVVQGWNMIGSISAELPTAAIVQNPPNIVVSNYYKFKKGYKITEIIEPGSGYWIKTNSPGELILSTEMLLRMPQYQSLNDILSAFNNVRVKDSNGQEQVLYFGTNDDDIVKTDFFELPPPAPLGVFDVRFESNKMLETHSSEIENAIQLRISLNNVAYPLIVSWKVNKIKSIAYRLCYYSEGKLILNQLLVDKGNININELPENNLLLKIEPKFVPNEFALYQNYPNPFNPSTKIIFDLPFSSKVDLKIYNILGQEVMTIIDKLEFEEGRHEVEIFPTKLASGVYFYRIDAEYSGKYFRSVKKMLYLK